MDIKKYVYDSRGIIKYLEFGKIDKIVDVLQKAKKRDSRIYVMGNGGSATTASHIAGDLNKTCGLKALALTDSQYLITALANDNGYEEIFSKQLAHLLNKGDVVIGISGSGNSQNIIYGIFTAKAVQTLTIGLTGFDGGEVKDLVDININVPSEIMEQIEDIHLMIGHLLIVELKNRGA